jgi:transposase
MDKTDARKLKTEVQQQLRKQAIRLRSMGMTYRDIANIVGVYCDTVGRWCRDYERHGTKGIKINRRGRKQGDQRNLTPEQGKRIQKAIVARSPIN